MIRADTRSSLAEGCDSRETEREVDVRGIRTVIYKPGTFVASMEHD